MEPTDFKSLCESFKGKSVTESLLEEGTRSLLKLEMTNTDGVKQSFGDCVLQLANDLRAEDGKDPVDQEDLNRMLNISLGFVSELVRGLSETPK